MKAYILLGDNVFLERFNIVSPPSLLVRTELIWLSLQLIVFSVCRSTTVPL